MQEGVLQEKENIAINMLNKNLDMQLVAEVTGLGLKDIESLAKNIH